MARYDVYAHPNAEGYLLELQTDLLDELKTRVVVPLIPSSPSVKTLRRLNPVFMIGGKQHTMFAHLIATVPTAQLIEPRTSLAKHEDQIVAALEMLFQGF
jgi:toxin CcdB